MACRDGGGIGIPRCASAFAVITYIDTFIKSFLPWRDQIINKIIEIINNKMI
jgi:hypothetical protein